MEAHILDVVYYLPQKIRTNTDITQKFPEWTEEKIFSKVGIRKRHIAADNETALDMSIKAAEILFSQKKILKEEIEFILFCTQSPDYKLPTSACIIQDKLGLKKSIGALDINLGCSGYVYGLSLAKGLVMSGIAKNVLLLTAETYSKYIHPTDRGNMSIFGDGASATIVSLKGDLKIGEFVFGTDGAGAEQLIIKNGGAKNSSFLGGEIIQDDGSVRSDNHLFMDGASIFSFTIKAVPVLVDSVLEKNRLNMDDVSLFVLHQANVFILEYLRKKMKIDEQRFMYSIENFGNTVSSTIPIALVEAIKADKIRTDNKILIAGFGVGLSWAGCVLDKIS